VRNYFSFLKHEWSENKWVFSYVFCDLSADACFIVKPLRTQQSSKI